MEVYVVTIDSHRYFDECEHSYLPLFHKVFGVYHTKDEAVKAVYRCFCDDASVSKYEMYLDDYSPNGEYLGHDDMFLYKDEKYGGYAIYGVDYYLEKIIK